MRNRIVAALGIVMVGATLAAEQGGGTITKAPGPVSGVSTAVTFSAPLTIEGGGKTNVAGSIIDVQQIPVAKVKVRLRNTDTGEVIGEAISDENGAYAFPDVEPGNYVVEMYVDNRYIVALSNAGAVSRDQTWNTVIQLAGRWETGTQTVVTQQYALNFVGVSAATSMTAATLTEAVMQEIRTVETGVMVSPR
jgi:hypothetical protein